MKKLLLAILAPVLLMAATSANAQTAGKKFGYFDHEYLLQYMKGIEEVGKQLQSFQQDSLDQEREFRMTELGRLDSTLRADSAKLPKKIYDQRLAEMREHFYIVQNWSQYAQNLVEGKQQQLLAPYYEKISAAFQKVVANGKYDYVFKREAFYVAPPADNLNVAVAKELNITIPEMQQAAPAGGNAAPKPTTAPKK
ncbi:OmpH family outer membrane protein [Polluticaenibacter yanchengensis]|uniref:OmpH family outer membrane protein n=1 Tax=Polluticaenibacter yanchengensis TaxID=3014562 RepID=A0ABT4UH53_9BACT|nr:OmpH family outer membrane protein [Chitinophagaceae bacterium LY-5]